jgi:hypothetical protein
MPWARLKAVIVMLYKDEIQLSSASRAEGRQQKKSRKTMN